MSLSLWLSLYATNLCIFHLVLPCFVLSGLVLLLLLLAWRCMSSCYITLSYHIISHILLFYLFCWFDLHSILFYSILFEIDSIWFYFVLFYFISNLFDLVLFYSILFYFISNIFDLIWFYSILFYWIRFTILVSIVSHINEWFVSICPSVYLFICMNKFMFSHFFLFLFFLLFLHSFLMNVFLTHTHGHTHTDTDAHIYMNICSFLWLVHITSKAGKWRIVFEWLYYLIFDSIR